MRTTIAKLRIGLLNKKRGNFAIQEKLIGADKVVDETDAEVEHHERALTEAGYSVSQIRWGPNFIKDLQALQVDLVFNVSSLVEAAILEELEIPYVGSDTFTIAIATDKSLAKRLWQQVDLPTSPFCLARSENDCKVFRGRSTFRISAFHQTGSWPGQRRPSTTPPLSTTTTNWSVDLWRGSRILVNQSSLKSSCEGEKSPWVSWAMKTQELCLPWRLYIVKEISQLPLRKRH